MVQLLQKDMKKHMWFFMRKWSYCMNTRDITSEYRLAHWAQIARDRSDRGLTVKAYCEENGIHENTYFYWQRKLREAACTEMPPAEAQGETIPNGWALCVKNDQTQTQGLTVEIGGCRITVSAETDPALLAKVCRALKEI